MTYQTRYMSHNEGASVREVIQQFDFSEATQDVALALVDDRARSCPFNTSIAYMVACSICARLERDRERAGHLITLT